MTRHREMVIADAQEITGSYVHKTKTLPSHEDGEGWNENAPAITYGVSASARRETWDEVAPGFKRRSAAGEIINQPYASELTEVFPWNVASVSQTDTYTQSFYDGEAGEVRNGLIGYVTEGTTVPWTFWNNAPPFLGAPQSLDTAKLAVLDAAVTEAFSRVSRSEMLAGASLAEARKTTDFLFSTAKRVVNIARAARRLDAASVLRLTRGGRRRLWKIPDSCTPMAELRREVRFPELANRYMELRYAVRPLIYDMVGGLKALDKPKKRLRKTFRGFKAQEFSYEDELIGLGVFFRTSVDVHRSYKCSYGVRAGVLCDIDITGLSSFGMEADSMIPTMWELLPFSFIVDWFANVGATIGAQIPKAGVNQLASWATVSDITTVENRLKNSRSMYPDRPTQVENSSTMGSSKSVVRVTRKERIPSPSLRTWPQAEINLDLYKLTDLSIILKGIFR